MDAIETFEVDGLTVKIYPDQDAESPREWDNLGKFALNHRRYDLPWEVDASKDCTLQELYDELVNQGAVVVLKIYGYDHSVFTISAESFYGRAQHAEWDSGVLGLACVFKDDLLRDHNRKHLSKKLVTTAERILRGEVKAYDEYLTGEAYGYCIFERDEDEDYEPCDNLESCWGFFGLDYCKQEARAAAEYVAKNCFDPAI